MKHSIGRFIEVFLTGGFLVMMVLGSFNLAQVDTRLIVLTPTRAWQVPTPTLFPTALPPTGIPTGVPLASSTPASEVTVETTPTMSATSTVTPVSILIGVCSPPAGWLPYILQPGDTVLSLAVKTQTRPHLLLQGNCMGSTVDLKVGDTLYLPAVVLPTPTPMPTTKAVCEAPAGWIRVTVNAGETYYTLSIRYGVTVPALLAANCTNTDYLRTGQPLWVPPYMVVPPTATPWPTPYPVATWTLEPTWTPTEIPLDTPTPTATLTPDYTWTPVYIETPTPTAWIEPTATPTSTSWVPTPTPTPNIEPTSTPVPSLTPTDIATPIPSLTPTP